MSELETELSWVVQNIILDLSQVDDAEPRWGRIPPASADTIVDVILKWLEGRDLT